MAFAVRFFGLADSLSTAVSDSALPGFTLVTEPSPPSTVTPPGVMVTVSRACATREGSVNHSETTKAVLNLLVLIRLSSLIPAASPREMSLFV